MQSRRIIAMEDAMTLDGNERTGAAGPAAVAETVCGDEDRPHDPRYQRIVDYLNTALAIEDPLAANVAATNSDLMLMAYRLKQAIATAMEMTPAALEEFEKLMPAVDSFLRITRQVERFAKLNLQLAAPAKSPPADLLTVERAGPTESEEIES
jgi:hypothetical protein